MGTGIRSLSSFSLDQREGAQVSIGVREIFAGGPGGIKHLPKQISNKHGDVFRSWLCPNFLLVTQKISVAQNLGGGPATPLLPRPVRLRRSETKGDK